jgi:hypothetical protein
MLWWGRGGKDMTFLDSIAGLPAGLEGPVDSEIWPDAVGRCLKD